MKLVPEKLREQLERVIGCWQVEFDIDNYTIIGVLEDIQHGLIWGSTPSSAPDEDDDDDEEDDD